MRNSKLVHFLKLLTPGEIAQFRRFLQSPYYTKKPELLSMLDETARIAQTKYKNLTEEELYDRITIRPGSEYDQNWLRKTKTELTQLVLEYLAQLEFEHQEAWKQKYLLSAFNRRGESKYFEYYYEEAKATLARQEFQDARFYNSRVDVEMEEFTYSIRTESQAGNQNISESIIALDAAYFAQKLKLAHYALHLEHTYGDEFPIFGLHETLNYVYKYYDHLPPLVQLYYRLYMAFEDMEDLLHYDALKAIYQEHFTTFGSQEREDIVTNMLNYCIERGHQGDEEFLPELLFWYKIMIREDMLMVDLGKFSKHFLNITATAGKIGELDFLESFMKKYGPKLMQHDMVVAYHYNKAVFHYYKKEYNTAKSLFLLVIPHMDEIFYSMMSRVFLLRLFYENREFEAMEDMCFSFKIFLDRDKTVSKRRKKDYYVFIRYIGRLIKIKEDDVARHKKFLTKLKNEDFSSGKEWLMNAVKERIAAVGQEEKDFERIDR